MAYTKGLNGATIREHYDSVGLAGGPERILDFTLRTGPFGDRYGENPDGVTLDKLKAQPNGINFGPMVPQVPEILGTADGKIRLAPQYLLDDLPRLAGRLDRAPDELVLVSRRHLRSIEPGPAPMRSGPTQREREREEPSECAPTRTCSGASVTNVN